MQDLQQVQCSNPNPMTQDEICKQVLGKRRGHQKGRGGTVRAKSTSTSSSQSTGQSQPGTYMSRDYIANLVSRVQADTQANMRAEVQTQVEA